MAAATVAAPRILFVPPEISLDRNNFYTGPPKKPMASSGHRAITAPEKRPSSKSKEEGDEEEKKKMMKKIKRLLKHPLEPAKYMAWLFSGALLYIMS